VIDSRPLGLCVNRISMVETNRSGTGATNVFQPWLVDGLDWIIVGGESGPRARPFCQEWAEATIAQCKAAGVPFFKQYGSEPVDGDGVAITLKDRKGGDLREWPKALRVREWPEART